MPVFFANNIFIFPLVISLYYYKQKLCNTNTLCYDGLLKCFGTVILTTRLRSDPKHTGFERSDLYKENKCIYLTNQSYLGFPWWYDLCTLLRFHSNVTFPVA
jgi:hypothetical protein